MSRRANPPFSAKKIEDLDGIANHIEQEVRMILPGIQALFGFQLVAVFNQKFSELPAIEQKIHLVALFCSALAMGCALIPPAYHRIAEPNEVSGRFCWIGSRCLSAALFPLAVGMSLDLSLITDIITHSNPTAWTVGIAAFLLYISSWFIFPQIAKRRFS